GHIGFGAAVHQARAVTDRHRQQSAHRRASYPGRPIFSNSRGEAVAEPSAEISTPKKTTPCQRPTQRRARCTCIACHDLPLTVVMLRRDVDANDRHCQLSRLWYARRVGGAAARVGRSFARLSCCPTQTERGRKSRAESAKLTMPGPVLTRLVCPECGSWICGMPRDGVVRVLAGTLDDTS